MVTELHNEIQEDLFLQLSPKVTQLIERTHHALFTLNEKDAMQLSQDCSYLTKELRSAEARCNDSLLVGITCQEDRLEAVVNAQRLRRLKKVVHQIAAILQAIIDIASTVPIETVARFKDSFELAEQELKDAILSILRQDEQLAFSVRKNDKKLDILYQEELESIFNQCREGASYSFQSATNLLFILRAIERIGDHAKNLAVPSFFHLVNNH